MAHIRLDVVLHSEEAVHASITKLLKSLGEKYEARPSSDVAMLMNQMRDLKVQLRSLILIHKPMLEQPQSQKAPMPKASLHHTPTPTPSTASPPAPTSTPTQTGVLAPVISPAHVETLALVSSPQLKIVAIGNPGTGKSTFMNCLLGSAHFASGLSFGGGLTKRASEIVHENVVYADTPGLADQVIEKAAATEITQVLKRGGAFKLLFFVRLEAGRLVTDDLVTIQRVLGALHANVMNEFSVVVNNLPEMVFQTLSRRGPEFERVMEHFNSMKYITQRIVFNPTNEALSEQDNAVATLPKHVIDFVNNAPAIRLNGSQVGEIDTSDYRAEVDQLRDKIEAEYRKKAMLARQLGQAQHPQEVRPPPVAYARPVSTELAPLYPQYVTVIPCPNDQPTMPSNTHTNARPRSSWSPNLPR